MISYQKMIASLSSERRQLRLERSAYVSDYIKGMIAGLKRAADLTEKLWKDVKERKPKYYGPNDSFYLVILAAHRQLAKKQSRNAKDILRRAIDRTIRQREEI